MKIFQAYYKDDQRAHLDKEFTPYDNTANPVVNLHEYHIYTKIYEEAQKTNEDLWGHFSWKWRSRIPEVNAQQVIDIINLDKSYDVYTFVPYPQEAIRHWNVWEHGQWCHPLILELTEKIFIDMEIDPVTIQRPMGTMHYLVANYFVGNRQFWDGLMAFLKRFVESLDRFDGEMLAKLDSCANYRTNMSLNYRGFICERMISTYLMLNPQLRIRPFVELYNIEYSRYPSYRENMRLKDDAIHNRDVASLKEYLNTRPAPRDPNGEGLEMHNWGNDWINTCVL